MAPIAKIFHNLPELSDDFRRLLKDLMDAAPNETPSTQMRVAAELTDTPYDEGLRRMAEYADFVPDERYLPVRFVRGTDILSKGYIENNPYVRRIERKLGRPLTLDEEQNLGYSDRDWPLATKAKPSARLEAINKLNELPMYNNAAALTGNYKPSIEALQYASQMRKAAQQRMALDYLLEGLL